jgi:nitrogen fixation protein FixH
VTSILRHGSFWALLPVVLLGSLVTVQLLLVRLVLSDASFSVEKSYYSKAVNWDETRARELASARLGWNVDAAVVPVSGSETQIAIALFDRTGSALHGAELTVEAFAVARADHVIRAVLREDADGSYRARLPVDRAGRWEFALHASRGNERFTDVFRRDLTAGAAR